MCSLVPTPCVQAAQPSLRYLQTQVRSPRAAGALAWHVLGAFVARHAYMVTWHAPPLPLCSAALDVQQGKIGMTVTYAGIPIWTQSDDLCAKTTCPIAKGPADVVYLQPMPIFTPPVSTAWSCVACPHTPCMAASMGSLHSLVAVGECHWVHLAAY